MDNIHTSPPAHESLKSEVPIEHSAGTWKIPRTLVKDSRYGVPNEQAVNEIRNELLGLLVQKGIDASTVVFSGYSGDAHNKADEFVNVEKKQIETRIKALAAKANNLYVERVFEARPALRDRYKSEIASLKEKQASMTEDVAHYFFGSVEALSAPENSRENPIEYAGVSSSATIAVYDLHLLPPEVEFESEATLTPDQVDRALIFEFRPRYTDEHYKPF